MCFSVWTILKDQWKGSVIKGLYVSRLIVSWEARFQPSRRKMKNFQSVHFFFFFVTGESLLPTPLQKKKRKIFCNFCASNHCTHASTQALLIWGSKKSLEGRHPSPFCRKKNISSVSPVSFSTWGGKKLCFKLHSGLLPTASPPSHHHGYWATTPMRHHDGGRS